ncbi:MAG: hypothetical protein ABJB93_10750 [Gaiellales bacterium]
MAAAAVGGRADVTYPALTSHMGTVVGFRFQTLGFFLVALGFIVNRNDRSVAILVLILAAGLWIVELKTRVLLDALGEEGRSMERDLGGGAFTAQYPETLGPDAYRHVEVGAGWRVPFPFQLRHTLGLDLVYVGVILWALVLLVRG